ncbi:MAG: glycosyl transferase family 1 [Bacteroidota bacterium]|jgi:glycosyltransferase involved in cell wall biosynthesis|nr:glycosyl transferase family 1 [Bacteroidota bacterium]
MRFLFLYTEIAEYFLSCCKELSRHGEVYIVRWPVNKEAPFKFTVGDNITIYDKPNYTLDELRYLVAKIEPDVIICSGWIDKDYLKITRSYFKKIPTILTCDTHWNGTIKQRIATLFSRFTILKIFSHGWVPGRIQKVYLKKLGFPEHRISEGFYSCNLPQFQSIYLSEKPNKEIKFPKRFLYVGRYYEFKGIKDLWNAFIELDNEEPNDWELWCLGTGDIPPVSHPKIKHFGFIQPEKLNEYTSQTGVFILPSHFEPWGVVVHEFAASGFPLILSDQVGSREQFLEAGKNGYLFESKNVNDLKIAMKKIMSSTTMEIVHMSEHSHQLSKRISPELWVDTLLKMARIK